MESLQTKLLLYKNVIESVKIPGKLFQCHSTSQFVKDLMNTITDKKDSLANLRMYIETAKTTCDIRHISDSKRVTPLMKAAMKGNKEIVQYLFIDNNYASIRMVDLNGWNVYHYAALYKQFEILARIYIKSLTDTHDARYVIHQKTIVKKAGDYQMTPLYMAVCAQSKDIVEFLITGVKCAPDIDQMTINKALKLGNQELALYLKLAQTTQRQ